MYDGGAGMKVFQFVKKECNDGYPCYWRSSKREESPCVPIWFENRSKGYIQGVQSGFVGPVVSYYQRVDAKRRSFW